MVKFNSATNAIFDGEEMTDDFSDEMLTRFRHVIDSIAAFAELDVNGSNAQEVYEDVIRILTNNVEGAYVDDGSLKWSSTISDRWEALKKRCIANGDKKKFNLLEKEKTNAIWGNTKRKISAMGGISTRDETKKKMTTSKVPDMFM